MKVPGRRHGQFTRHFAVGSDATTIFTDDTEAGTPTSFTKSPTSGGASSAQNIGPDGFFGKRIHFDRATGNIYSDGGPIRDSNGVIDGTFDVSQPTDPTLRSWFPTRTSEPHFSRNTVRSGPGECKSIRSSWLIYSLSRFDPIERGCRWRSNPFAALGPEWISACH